MMGEITRWEQQQIMDAYPHMKGGEAWFRRHYQYLEKWFRRCFFLSITVSGVSMIVLMIL